MAAVLAATSLVGLGAGPARAVATIHVPTAQPTIQAAIETASTGDTVVVAPGTYHERIDFKGKAIEVKSSAGPETTIIDGDATGITAVFHTAETRASVLRGFTITDGLQPPMQEQLVGGGIAVQGASPTIVGNVVTANVGSGIGVALGSPLIQDNVITDNDTTFDGGGVFAGGASEIVGNRIEGNGADSGGGLIVFGSAVIRDNVIRGNHAGSRHGGGVAFYGGMVVNNLILDNTADVKGGGVLWRTNGLDRLLHNTIVGNRAPTGSAMADVATGTVAGNIVVGPAGASLVSCALTEGGPLSFAVNNVYNGTSSRYEDCGGDPTGWNGNVSADPLFGAPAASPPDYRLQAGSPAVDAGDPGLNVLLPATDFAGGPRVTDGDGDEVAVADMGAYETPAAVVGGRYHALQPSRILDTRIGLGSTAALLGPGSTLNLQVTGRDGIPGSGVSAVVLNVAVTEPTATSFLTAWPAGLGLPLAANLNFVAGQTVANMVVVKVGAGGQVSLYNNSGATHVVADVAGWYGEQGVTSGSKYTSVAPSRILDTRSGIGAPAAALDAGTTYSVQVTGLAGVPAVGVSAVILNVTVTEPSAASFLTTWPGGTGQPSTSSLNYAAGQTVPNVVVARVGDNGTVSLAVGSGTAHVVADVAGWFGLNGAPGGSGYSSVVPARILDTRFGVGATAVPVGPASTLELQVTGRGGIPATGVSAVVLNVTVTQPTATSFLTAWPTGTPFPLAANLNYVPNLTVPNLVVVKVGDGGRVSLYNNSGTTHVVADVAGWYSG